MNMSVQPALLLSPPYLHKRKTTCLRLYPLELIGMRFDKRTEVSLGCEGEKDVVGEKKELVVRVVIRSNVPLALPCLAMSHLPLVDNVEVVLHQQIPTAKSYGREDF